MALTKGEVVQVLGRTVEKIGFAFDDEESPDVVTKEEIFELVKDTLQDLLAEYSD